MGLTGLYKASNRGFCTRGFSTRGLSIGTTALLREDREHGLLMLASSVGVAVAGAGAAIIRHPQVESDQAAEQGGTYSTSL